MFGQASFGGFGQPQSQPAFGSSPSSSPFGGSTAFGQQPAPFGASTGTSVFGASQPAFGAAASTPAFGAPQSQSGMFGSSAFGAKPAGGFSFGGTSATPASPFGAPSQPAFGAAQSNPAFGGFGASSTPAFGAPTASTPAFGASASSTPAFGGFGASSTPAFAAATPAPAFGTPGGSGTPSPFGAPATGAFGASPTGFGAATPQQQNMGSRVAPYQKHQDKDTSSSSSTAPTTVYYASITAMPQYQNKSVEELRWEDYQAGVKHQGAAPAPTAAPAAAAFGAPAAGATGTPAFGGFGASTGGAFGAPASTGGLFGASNTPAFAVSSTPAFGAASSPSLFGGAFGSTPATSTPAFGGFGAAASQPAAGGGLFGAAQSSPATGFGFGGTSTPAFGAASGAPAFGASSTPSLFGGSTFGATTGGGLFGSSGTPAFGATSSASPFGPSSTPTFGAPGSSPFGTPATPASTGFGVSTGFSFGTPAAAAAKPPTAGGFSFGSQASSGGLFGAPATTGSLFGGSSTPAFGSTGGLFGPSSTPAAGTSLFGSTGAFGVASPSTTLFGTAATAQGAAPGTGGFSFSTGAAPGGGGLFGNAGAQQAPVAPLAVNQQPYGVLQPLPQVNVPDYKVGITQRPVRQALTSMRPSPLLTLRTATPKFGLSAGGSSSGRGVGSIGALPATLPGAGSPFSLSAAASPAGGSADGRGGSGSPAAALLLPVRDNPHRLFIRSPPPSTTPAANGSSFSPIIGPTRGGTADGVSDKDASPARTQPSHRTYEPAETPTTNGSAKQQQQQHEPGSAGRQQNGSSSKEQQRGRSSAAGQQAYGAAAPAADSPDAPQLGALAERGYSTEPNQRELQALARWNPAALEHLSGFKLRREGFGQLEWLQPVDVRSVNLENIVQIDRGEVSLYTSCPSSEKPPIGSGLNCHCRITLYGVYRKSKQQQSQSPAAAAAAAAAFRKRLARYCSDMGAKFVNYEPEGGVWMFEVEHFSRYAAPMDEDSDEDILEEMHPQQQQQQHKQSAATAPQYNQQKPQTTFGGPSAETSEQDMEATAAPHEGSSEEGDDDEIEQQQEGRLQISNDDVLAADRPQDGQVLEAESAGFDGVPLQHALPALLGHRADDLMELRGAFFGRGGTGIDTEAAAAAAPVSPMLTGDGRARGAEATGVSRSGAGSIGVADKQRQLLTTSEHNWVRPRPVLLYQPQQHSQQRSPQQQQLALYDGRLDQHQQDVALPATAAAALVVASVTSRALQQQKLRYAAATAGAPAAAAAVSKHPGLLTQSFAVSNSDLVVDASLMLGRSFRVGWGPNGVLAIPLNPGLAGDSATAASAGSVATASTAAASGGSSNISVSVTQADASGRPCVVLRQLQPVAAVAVAGSSSVTSLQSDGGAAATAAVEGMQQRVLGALQLQLQQSSSNKNSVGQNTAEADDMIVDSGQDGGGAASTSSNSAAQWQLHCDRKQLPSFVKQQVAAVEEGAAATAAKATAVAAIAGAAHAKSSSNGSSSHCATAVAYAGCGLHVCELWQLLQVLYGYIEGEDDSNGSDDRNALDYSAANGPSAAISNSDVGDSNGDSGGIGEAGSSRQQLAVYRRKAALSKWLQRKLKPVVEAALQDLQNPSGSTVQQQQQLQRRQQESVLWSLLHLMSGRQIAAAVAAASAVGDVRLATLLAAAGQAAAAGGGQQIVQQMQTWALAGLLPRHISTPRRLLLVLLAATAPPANLQAPGLSGAAGGFGGLIEVTTALKLDWARAFGLWLWYGVPVTEPVSAVSAAFNAALAVSPQLPRPVPPHAYDPCILLKPQQQGQKQKAAAVATVNAHSQSALAWVPAGNPSGSSNTSGSSSLAAAAAAGAVALAADTQYALLQLHAHGGYGLGIGLYPENSHDESNKAVSSQQGQSVGALVGRLLRVAGHSVNPLDYSTAWQLLLLLEAVGALPSRREEYESVAVATCSSFIAQLLLLLRHSEVEWALFAALHIPEQGLSAPGTRAAVLQQLLELTAPQWCGRPAAIVWLKDTLHLPLRWLHTAQATWFGYCRQHCLQLLHLIAAGDWQAAQSLTCTTLAPLLLLTAATAGKAAAAREFTGSAAKASTAALWALFSQGSSGGGRSAAFTAAANFSAAAAAFLATDGSDGISNESAGNELWWSDASTLAEDPTAAVAAAHHVAISILQTASGQDNTAWDASNVTTEALQHPARTAAVALREVCRVLGVMQGALGPAWQLGAGVYAAWCGVFLDPEGDVWDPAVQAAMTAAAAADRKQQQQAGSLTPAEAVEGCLHLANILSNVAGASSGSNSRDNGNGSAWWGPPLQRLVLSRMTSDVNRALVRLGASSSSDGGMAQQQQVPLLVPLAAAGYGAVAGDILGPSIVVANKSQTYVQLLAGAAANIAGVCMQ